MRRSCNGRYDRQHREDVLDAQRIFRVKIFLLRMKAGRADPSRRNLLGGFDPNLACQEFLHQAAFLFLNPV